MSHPCFSLTENENQELIFNYDAEQAANAKPPERLEIEQLRTWLEDKGYGDLDIDNAALKIVAQTISEKTNPPSFSQRIAFRRDAHYDIIIPPDRMSAHLQVQPPAGGRAASLAAALKALEQENVTFGIDPNAVQKAVDECGKGSPTQVATGQAPIPGTETQFTPLVEVNLSRHPRANKDGRVNLRDLGKMPSVKTGDPVMQRTPPTPGKPGTNIHGDPVSPPTLRDIPFNARLTGVDRDPNNPDILIASQDGQPVMLPDGVNVEPLATFNEGINIQTGNVDFVGTVTVHGDIQSGMKIRVGGDLIVEGAIEAADIEAGGNIVVKGGIIGQMQQKNNCDEESFAHVHAQGNVQARYIENARVLAGQSVIVTETLTNSDVMAVNKVHVGRPGSKRGYILGGFIRATHGVEAEFLGGPGATQTRVFVGVNPLIQKKMEDKKKFLAAKIKEHADLSKLVKILQSQPDKKAMLAKARHTMSIVTHEINQAIEEERELVAEIGEADAAEILVSGGIFGGTRISLGKKSLFIAEDVEQQGVFRIHNGQAAFINRNGDPVDI